MYVHTHILCAKKLTTMTEGCGVSHIHIHIIYTKHANYYRALLQHKSHKVCIYSTANHPYTQKTVQESKGSAYSSISLMLL